MARIPLILLMVVWLAGPAIAGLRPAILHVGNGTPTDSTNQVVGWAFSITNQITITELGVFDNNGNGVVNESQPPAVGIWNEGGTLLASTNIPFTATNEVGFFYEPIAPLAISTGTYVVGAVNYQGGELFRIDAVLQLDPEIEWIEGRVLGGDLLQFPTGVRTNPAAYFGPGFKFRGTDLCLSEPRSRSVRQRDPHNCAELPVAGSFGGTIDRVEVEVTPVTGYTGTAVPRHTLDASPSGGAFSGSVTVKGGWYRVDVFGMLGNIQVSSSSLEPFGVGEVFLTAGQSNSANHGAPSQTPVDDRVSNHDLATGWRQAADPQPFATGSGGSPWPAFGDALAASLDVPVGLISVGWGGSSIAEWIPGFSRYPRMLQALSFLGPDGLRAVLWHQGETDSQLGTSTADYAQRLESIIAQSRIDAGFDVPWGVALASYNPSATEENEAKVIAGQQQVIAADPLVFLGAQTDAYHTNGWLSDTIHFNEAGLTDHGNQWAQQARAFAFPRPQLPVSLIGIARAGSNVLQVSWLAESNVTYQVEFAPDVTSEPMTWAPVTNWIVGPDSTLDISIDSLPAESYFRLLLPHTDY